MIIIILGWGRWWRNKKSKDCEWQLQWCRQGRKWSGWGRSRCRWRRRRRRRRRRLRRRRWRIRRRRGRRGFRWRSGRGRGWRWESWDLLKRPKQRKFVNFQASAVLAWKFIETNNLLNNVIDISLILSFCWVWWFWVSLNFRRGTHGKMLKLSLLGIFSLVYNYTARTVIIIHIGLNS